MHWLLSSDWIKGPCPSLAALLMLVSFSGRLSWRWWPSDPRPSWDAVSSPGDGQVGERGSLSYSVPVTLTGYPRWGGLNDTHWFLTVLDAGSPRSRSSHMWCLVRTHLVIFRQSPSRSVLTERESARQRGVSSLSSWKGSDPIMDPHPQDLI